MIYSLIKSFCYYCIPSLVDKYAYVCFLWPTNSDHKSLIPVLSLCWWRWLRPFFKGRWRGRGGSQLTIHKIRWWITLTLSIVTNRKKWSTGTSTVTNHRGPFPWKQKLVLTSKAIESLFFEHQNTTRLIRYIIIYRMVRVRAVVSFVRLYKKIKPFFFKA